MCCRRRSTRASSGLERMAAGPRIFALTPRLHLPLEVGGRPRVARSGGGDSAARSARSPHPVSPLSRLADPPPPGEGERRRSTAHQACLSGMRLGMPHAAPSFSLPLQPASTFFSLPLQGGGSGWGSACAGIINATPTRTASQSDLPLLGGGKRRRSSEREVHHTLRSRVPHAMQRASVASQRRDPGCCSTFGQPRFKQKQTGIPGLQRIICFASCCATPGTRGTE